MKLLIKNDTDVVIYAGDDCSLTENYATYGKAKAMMLNSSNCRIDEVNSMPEGFVAGSSTYRNGQWSYDQNSMSFALESLKDIKISEIKRVANEKFWSDYPCEGTFIQFRNEYDRLNITNLRQIAETGASVEVIMKDNSVKTFTPQEFINITNAMFAQKSKIKINARLLSNTVLWACLTVQDIESVDISVGWQ